MQFYVVIVAGGSGKRMGAEIPKQFLELAGRPVLMHTIERFKSFNDSVEIITVLPEDQLRHWIELKEKYSFNVPETLVKGGSHRFDSVKNGLQFVNAPGVVAIHDGVRPFVSIETIKRCFETAEKLGNAIPSISITEQFCKTLSTKADDKVLSSKTLSQSTSFLFVVMMVDFCSCLFEMISKKSSTVVLFIVLYPSSSIINKSGLQ